MYSCNTVLPTTSGNLKRDFFITNLSLMGNKHGGLESLYLFRSIFIGTSRPNFWNVLIISAGLIRFLQPLFKCWFLFCRLQHRDPSHDPGLHSHGRHRHRSITEEDSQANEGTSSVSQHQGNQFYIDRLLL